MLEGKITFDRFVRILGTLLIIAIVLLLTNYLSGVLLPFFVGWLIAYLLHPIVRLIEKKLHVKWRGLSILLTFVLVTGVLAGMGFLMIPPMIDQGQKLQEILSHWINSATNTNNVTAWIQHWFQENEEQVVSFLKSKDFWNVLKSTAPKLFSFVGQTAYVIWSVIGSLITLLYTFFILFDYEYLADNWARIFPPKYRPFWQGLFDDATRELNNYIRGQGLIALSMAILFGIGFTIMNFPMGITLAIMIGIMDMVPYLHTLAIVPTAFLAMLKAADTGQSFLLVFGLAIGLFCLVQLIIDLIITPKIMGKAMNLNPAILLLSLSVWGVLLGFIGLIIAYPLTSLIMAYWQRYVTKEREAEAIKIRTGQKKG